MNKKKINSKELTEAHWKYIKEVLTNHGIFEAEIERIGFHYQTAMIHGYKHGYADAMDEPLFIPPKEIYALIKEQSGD